MEPIIIKIELSATPELFKVLSGLLQTTGVHNVQSLKSVAVTQDEVTNRVKELIATGFKKDVIKLLKEFGVSKASELEVADYDEFIKQASSIH